MVTFLKVIISYQLSPQISTFNEIFQPEFSTFNWVLFSEIHSSEHTTRKSKQTQVRVHIHTHTSKWHNTCMVLQLLFQDNDTRVFKEVTMASHNIMAPSYLCSKYQYMLKFKNEKGTNTVFLYLKLMNRSPMVTLKTCNI